MLGGSNTAVVPEGVTFEAVGANYSGNARIQFTKIFGPTVSWLTLASNKTDFTFKKGGLYFITYTFTPTTVDGLVEGMGTYAKAPVWTTSGYSTLIDTRSLSNDLTEYLKNSGSSTNSYVWFRLTIIRLMGGV